MLKTILKTPNIPNFIQFGQAIRKIFLFGTILVLFQRAILIWYLAHRKWHHMLTSIPKSPHIPNFIQFGQAKWEIFLFGTILVPFLVRDTNMVPRTPKVTSPCWKPSSKPPNIPNFIQFGQAIREIFLFGTIWVPFLKCDTNMVLRTPKVTSACWKPSPKTHIYQISSNLAKRFGRYSRLGLFWFLF